MDVITNTIKYKCLQFFTKPEFGPENCLVYLRLPRIGNASMQFLEPIKRPINHCFISVKLRVVLKSKVLFSPKSQRQCDCSSKKSSLVYLFTCKWDIYSLGRTNQRLEVRINQHIPLSIRTHTSDYTTTPSSYNSTSAIGRYLRSNQTCTCVYNPTMFTWRHQQINCSYPVWKDGLSKNTNRNYVPESHFILSCFLISF